MSFNAGDPAHLVIKKEHYLIKAIVAHKVQKEEELPQKLARVFELSTEVFVRCMKSEDYVFKILHCWCTAQPRTMGEFIGALAACRMGFATELGLAYLSGSNALPPNSFQQRLYDCLTLAQKKDLLLKAKVKPSKASLILSHAGAVDFWFAVESAPISIWACYPKAHMILHKAGVLPIILVDESGEMSAANAPPPPVPVVDASEASGCGEDMSE